MLTYLLKRGAMIDIDLTGGNGNRDGLAWNKYIRFSWTIYLMVQVIWMNQLSTYTSNRKIEPRDERDDKST